MVAIYQIDKHDSFVNLFGVNIVYNIHLLGKVPAQFQAKGDLVPKFTVGVNDIPELEGKGRTSYVACKF